MQLFEAGYIFSGSLASSAFDCVGKSIEDTSMSFRGDDALGTLRVLFGKILLKQETM